MVRGLVRILSVFALLILIPSVSALTIIGPDDVFNTSISNSSLTFNTCTWVVNEITVTPVSVEITGAADLSVGGDSYTFASFVNHTAENTNYNCAEIGENLGTLVVVTAISDSTPLGDIALKLTIGFVGLAILLFAIAGFFIFLKDNFQTMHTQEFLTWSILLVIVTFLMVALMNYIAGLI